MTMFRLHRPARALLAAAGLSAAIAWAFYNVGVDIGRSDGFSSADLALLRYGGATLLMAPLMLLRRSRMSGLTVPRLALLTTAVIMLLWRKPLPAIACGIVAAALARQF